MVQVSHPNVSLAPLPQLHPKRVPEDTVERRSIQTFPISQSWPSEETDHRSLTMTLPENATMIQEQCPEREGAKHTRGNYSPLLNSRTCCRNMSNRKVDTSETGHGDAYQAGPATTAKSAIAGTAVLKSQLLIKWDQMIMCNKRDPLCDVRLFDPVDICLHQGGPNLLSLMFRQNRKGVDGNRSTLILMAQRLLPILVRKTATFGSPIRRIRHRCICNHRSGCACSNDVADQCWPRIRIVLGTDWNGEHAQ